MTRASIVIPVFNRVNLTRRCLEAILLEWPKDVVEVVVVDDGSIDSSGELLSRLAAENSQLRVVSRAENGGFAAACNAGASVATGEFLVFLNNDTIPQPGWLDKLVDYADINPQAAVVGAKLLFPDDTVQHAGVVIGQDHNPYHLYAGFPREHPVVNRSGQVPIVTAACMLVRRHVFVNAGGFDTSYRNGHEDVDFCLRLGELGHEVHYCHQSVVVHFESVTRGRQTNEAMLNGRQYREKWAAKVVPGDFARYMEDGLLRIEHEGNSVRLQIDPILGTADHGHRDACNTQLLTRTQQVSDLLRTVVNLLADVVPASASFGGMDEETFAPCQNPDLDEEVIEAVWMLNNALARRRGVLFEEGCPSSYRRLVQRVCGAIVGATPAGSSVAVVSRGDANFLDINERTGLHFPSDPSGVWLGYHPAGSDEVIGYLDDAIGSGATHLAIPMPSIWWLDQYSKFADLLRSEHRQLSSVHDCIIFELAASSGGLS